MPLKTPLHLSDVKAGRQAQPHLIVTTPSTQGADQTDRGSWNTDTGVRRSLAAPVRAFDICVGDADGLCSILQWRLHEPKKTHMVSVPLCAAASLRNFQPLPGDEVLACNVPHYPTRFAGGSGTAQQASIQCLDYRVYQANFRRPVPLHHAAANGCTSLMVDCLLQGKYRAWALVGAYGKQLKHLADAQATAMGVAASERDGLQRLGEGISYNADVAHTRHLYLEPANLYAQLARYEDPLEFLRCESLAQDLDGVRQSDLQHALALPAYWKDGNASVYVMPDLDWASRVSSHFKSQLCEIEPHRAHAVLTPSDAGYFRVAVQASIKPGSQARPKRWLIERLPASEMDHFINAFSATRWGALRSPVFRAWQ